MKKINKENWDVFEIINALNFLLEEHNKEEELDYNPDIGTTTFDTKPKKWKPESRYWTIDSIGNVRAYMWKDDSFDYDHYNFGNCFKTESEAEQARDKIKQLLK